jgi:hypothetical protein
MFDECHGGSVNTGARSVISKGWDDENRVGRIVCYYWIAICVIICTSFKKI